jgi:hypothetical protein
LIDFICMTSSHLVKLSIFSEFLIFFFFPSTFSISFVSLLFDPSFCEDGRKSLFEDSLQVPIRLCDTLQQLNLRGPVPFWCLFLKLISPFFCFFFFFLPTDSGINGGSLRAITSSIKSTKSLQYLSLECIFTMTSFLCQFNPFLKATTLGTKPLSLFPRCCLNVNRLGAFISEVTSWFLFFFFFFLSPKD